MKQFKDKILDRENAFRWISERKDFGYDIVFTNGCFDIIHLGHISYLEEAKSKGDFLVVAVNSDKSVKKLKGDKRPIKDENSRASILAAMSFVDLVVIFDEETPKELISYLSPDVLIKGGDYKIEEIVGAESVMREGGKVEVIKFLEGHSSSDLISKF